MHISYNLKKLIAEEFRYVVKNMKEEQDLAKKLYFLSATYGVIQRVFNIEYDSTLILIHLILNTAYTTINSRLIAVAQGSDIGVEIPKNLFDKLEELVEALAEAVEKDKNPSAILEEIVVLTYSTTGNGYYLYQKGMLKV